MTTLLIATDEAGYGPKLGPLAVVASAWQVPHGDGDRKVLDDWFAPLRTPYRCGSVSIRVDDSKRVFKPGDGLGSLHAVASAALAWAGHAATTLDPLLQSLAAEDAAAILSTPWLCGDDSFRFLDPASLEPVIRLWGSRGIELAAMRCRLITARVFNQRCDQGFNKADQLSELTLNLVRQLVDALGPARDAIFVYCDRHGGRRYYGGVVQHTFPSSQLQIVSETPQISRYRLRGDHPPVEISFMVNGESLTPVALSSLLAKYMRERMMERLNTYFCQRHCGPEPLRPTAGYPLDADRFVREIAAVMAAEKIAPEHLIRRR